MKVYAPVGTTAISFRGISTRVEADGSVDVDVDVFEELKAFGFAASPIIAAAPVQLARAAKAKKARGEAITAAHAAHAVLLDREGRGDTQEFRDAVVAVEQADALVVKLSEAL